jgi:hypothetical protein
MVFATIPGLFSLTINFQQDIFHYLNNPPTDPAPPLSNSQTEYCECATQHSFEACTLVEHANASSYMLKQNFRAALLFVWCLWRYRSFSLPCMVCTSGFVDYYGWFWSWVSGILTEFVRWAILPSRSRQLFLSLCSLLMRSFLFALLKVSFMHQGTREGGNRCKHTHYSGKSMSPSTLLCYTLIK